MPDSGSEASWWAAAYYDGVTSQRHEARVAATRYGLAIERAGAGTTTWLYTEIRKGAAPWSLQRNDEVLVLADEAAWRTLSSLAPNLRGFHIHRWVLAAGAIAAIAALPLLFLYAIPAAGGWLASLAPPAVEARMGQSIANALAPPENVCSDRALLDVVEGLTRRLAGAAPASPYTYRVRVADVADINAFAAPGGSIVLFRGLVRECGTAEELAAVLAHEMQHIEQRHSMKALGRGAALWLAMGMALGDAQTAAGLARGFVELSYAREDERAADREGLRALRRAGIDPRGMVRLFGMFRRRFGEGNAAAVRYLSSHPAPEERVRAAEREAGAGMPELMDKKEWEKVRVACK